MGSSQKWGLVLLDLITILNNWLLITYINKNILYWPVRLMVRIPDLQSGDMIARNPDNHNDLWLIAGEYFKNNFEEIK